ncbi:phage tail spike protein [Streptococcus oralis]|uniref:phage tail spike protein n=1 Tax=Streptococcus oralis TaxID=1303 RepID=UPI0022851AEE|nr:phage tail spike protein [Streptococcus oralis]MCY7070384.1 tail fiber domain-containing protein [Streptococcus oralis]
MIYLTNGNTPLNAAYEDKIVQEDGSTYQLTFRFPTSDSLWEKLKEETFLTADDLHGEQDFVIFEVKKKNGYIQVYANQVFTLLNNYVVNPISLDRQTGSTALSRFAGAITRNNPFSFFSDIEERHTFNVGSKNAMEVFAKDKHSIIGQWGGDLVRHGYQVRLLKNGGSENESLFMYKKNLSSYQHKTSTKSLKTRITFKTTVKGEGEKALDRKFSVVVDSPLINKYSQIYEDVIEVNDEDVKDEASLRKYGEQYFKTSLCDMMEDSLELEVVGQSDVPVQMYDIVSLFHEVYNLDVRKKITKYTYSPMANKLLSIGFGQFKSGLSNMVSNAVSDAVKNEAQQLQDDFERQLARELKNADLAFDRQKEELVNQFTDGLNAAKARAEEVKRELSDTIDQRFNSFNNGPLQEVKRRTEEALKNSGASSLLAQEAKRIGLDSVARLEAFKSQATSAQTALSGELDSLKRTIANDIRPKQAQAEAEIAKQVEALIQTKKELAGVKSAQATYEETTTRRLSELTNLANGKASKSELTQTAEQLASKIASVQAGSSRNYFRNSRSRTFTTGDQATYDYRTFIVPDFWKNSDRFKRDYVRISFDMTFPVALANDMPAMVHFSAHPWYAYRNLVFKGGTTERQHFEFTIDLSSSSETYQTNNVFIRFGTNYGFPAGLQVVIENAMLSVGNYFPAYQPAYEDQEDRVSIVESNFKQRADALDAGVSHLTEGLRTKADISALNVTAENIRQSVKSFETSTQDKLNQMLSLAEFEVRAGSIRQEILNATKDKADKTLVTAEAGKLREEFSSLRVGGTNFIRNYDWNRLLPLNGAGPSWEFERVEDQFAKSGYMLKATCTKNGNGGFHKVFFDLRAAEFQGKDMTWSWDIKSSRPITFYAMGFEAGGLKRNVPVSTEWERISNTFKVAFKQYYSCVFYANGWEVGDVVYIRDPQLEEGTIATSPKPAPEDTDGLITEAKATFERTAEGLRTDLSAIQEYVNKDGQRQEALRRYTREESARQATAVRELVTRDFVGKSTYQEDVRGLERRFNAISTQTNNDIATKIAQYKQTVDGRFTEITSMISSKANQTDFQRVQETSRLYERILGNTNNSISDNVARMAMTSQLFQVEVGKYGSDGINRALNTSKGWTSFITIASPAGINLNADLHKVVASGLVAGDKLHVCLEISIDDVQPITGKTATAVLQSWGDVKKWNSGNPFGYRLGNLIAGNNWRKIEYDVTLTEQMLGNNFWWLNVRVDGASRYKVHTKLLKIEKGSRATPWSPAPEDTDEAIRTVQSQLAGSWGVHNKNSVNEIIAGFNLAGRNAGIKAETIRLEGRTLLDELTAIQGYFKRLFVGEGTFATLNADVIRTNSITADKLVFNEALANRLVSNEIITSKLVASRAFVNALNAVTIDASQIVTGTLKGDRIYGGTIRGASIYGGTLTGHTQIQLGSYGSFDTVNGGLQINVPRDYNSKDGLGVQFIGSYGRGENVPYGLFLYRDSDFTIGNTATDTDEFLMTVQGYINAKGIGWLKTGKGSVNGKTTGTIGLWNSDNVSLSFGGSGNDIYYSYNGTAYSLWSVVNQHFSDRRLKDNIVDCKYKALDYIHQFQFKEYDWKKQEDRPQQAHTKIGLIAQEVQAVDPTLVYENGETLNLDNLRLTTIALKAIQELSQRIETLERKLA